METLRIHDNPSTHKARSRFASSSQEKNVQVDNMKEPQSVQSGHASQQLSSPFTKARSRLGSNQTSGTRTYLTNRGQTGVSSRGKTFVSSYKLKTGTTQHSFGSEFDRLKNIIKQSGSVFRVDTKDKFDLKLFEASIEKIDSSRLEILKCIDSGQPTNNKHLLGGTIAELTDDRTSKLVGEKIVPDLDMESPAWPVSKNESVFEGNDCA
jgi:hypothetical protein